MYRKLRSWLLLFQCVLLGRTKCHYVDIVSYSFSKEKKLSSKKSKECLERGNVPKGMSRSVSSWDASLRPISPLVGASVIESRHISVSGDHDRTRKITWAMHPDKTPWNRNRAKSMQLDVAFRWWIQSSCLGKFSFYIYITTATTIQWGLLSYQGKSLGSMCGRGLLPGGVYVRRQTEHRPDLLLLFLRRSKQRLGPNDKCRDYCRTFHGLQNTDWLLLSEWPALFAEFHSKLNHYRAHCCCSNGY